MQVIQIQFEDRKRDLPRRIAEYAPKGATSFRMGLKLSETCQLIEYGYGLEGSLLALRKALGIEIPRKQPESKQITLNATQWQDHVRNTYPANLGKLYRNGLVLFK